MHLIFIDEYWSQHPELHDIPIYYASSLAKKCMAVYQTYVNAMNDKIRRQIAINNPFVFKHISNLKVCNILQNVKSTTATNKLLNFNHFYNINLHAIMRLRSNIGKSNVQC